MSASTPASYFATLSGTQNYDRDAKSLAPLRDRLYALYKIAKMATTMETRKEMVRRVLAALEDGEHVLDYDASSSPPPGIMVPLGRAVALSGAAEVVEEYPRLRIWDLMSAAIARLSFPPEGRDKSWRTSGRKTFSWDEMPVMENGEKIGIKFTQYTCRVRPVNVVAFALLDENGSELKSPVFGIDAYITRGPNHTQEKNAWVEEYGSSFDQARLSLPAQISSASLAPSSSAALSSEEHDIAADIAVGTLRSSENTDRGSQSNQIFLNYLTEAAKGIELNEAIKEIDGSPELYSPATFSISGMDAIQSPTPLGDGAAALGMEIDESSSSSHTLLASSASSNSFSGENSDSTGSSMKVVQVTTSKRQRGDPSSEGTKERYVDENGNEEDMEGITDFLDKAHIKILLVKKLFRTSDERCKKNIARIVDVVPNFLEKIRSVSGMRYSLVEDVEKTFGFIAQALQEQFPYVVKEFIDKEGISRLAVDYEAVTPLHHEWIRMVDQRSEVTQELVDLIYKRVEAIEKKLVEKQGTERVRKFAFVARNLIDGALEAENIDQEQKIEYEIMAKEIHAILKEPEPQLKMIQNIVRSAGIKRAWRWANEAIAEYAGKKTTGGIFFAKHKLWKREQERKTERGKPHTDIRAYQMDIIAKLEKSSRALISLPTGTGKTLIAARVLLQLVPPHIPPGQQGTALFIVRDRSLADQQQHYLWSESPMDGPEWKVGCFVGGDPGFVNNEKLEILNTGSWNDVVKSCHVIVLTSGLLDKIIEEKGDLFDWSLIKAIVVDEVHNATKRHPFAKILDRARKETHLKIFGLSATPASANSEEQARIKLQKLLELIGEETKTHIILANNPCLEKYYSDPDIIEAEVETDYAQDKNKEELIQHLHNLIQGHVDAILEEINGKEKFSNIKVPNISENIGRKVSKFAKQIQRAEQERSPLYSTAWLLERIVMIYMSVQEVDDNILGPVLGILGEASQSGLHETLEIEINDDDGTSSQVSSITKAIFPILRLSAEFHDFNSEEVSGKFDKMIEILEEHKQKVSLGEDNNLENRVIVRLETRLGACWLHNRLLRHKNNMIRKPVLLLGQGSGNGVTDSFSLAESRENIEMFKKGESNLLVATSVIQEGIDVPDCNLVICFGGSVVSQGKDLVQLKGRARKTGESKLIVITQGLRDKQLLRQGICQALNQDIVLGEASGAKNGLASASASASTEE